MTTLSITIYFILGDHGINVFYFIILINDLFLSFACLFYSGWPKNKCDLFYFINKINENKCGLFLFINKWTLPTWPILIPLDPIWLNLNPLCPLNHFLAPFHLKRIFEKSITNKQKNGRTDPLIELLVAAKKVSKLKLIGGT